MEKKRPDKFNRWMIASFFLIPLVIFGITLGSYYFFTPVKMHILIHLLRYQKTAMWAFGKIYQEGEEAVPYIFGGLSSKHYPVRYWSLQVLRVLVLRKGVNYKPALTQVVKMVSDPHSNIRNTAGEVLGKIGADEAVGPLIKLLSHPRREVCCSAAIALGKIGSPKAVGPLISCLREGPMPGVPPDDWYIFQCLVIQALEKITGENFGGPWIDPGRKGQAIIQKCLDWWEENKEKYEVGEEDATIEEITN